RPNNRSSCRCGIYSHGIRGYAMNPPWNFLAPLAILSFLLAYTKLAKHMKIPKPVYWITMVAGGFLLMSLFTTGS
ncbi:MAG: hypothetical protein VXY93_20000, partial [Pseudomonadota bacterium]|nr:hypothetical protein [Pseudomonadota bacterium]